MEESIGGKSRQTRQGLKKGTVMLNGITVP